jgi:hypothetical protein
VWCNRRIVRLGHARDEAALGDAAGVAQIRLQDHRRLLLENFPEAPLREDPLAGRNRQVRATRDVGHRVDVLAVDRFFDEHRLVRLDCLDQELRGGGADRAVEVDADVGIRTNSLAQHREVVGRLLHEAWRLDESRPAPRAVLIAAAQVRSGLEGGEALRLLRLDRVNRARVRVDADAVASRPTQQFMDRHAKRLALDVPQRLVDARQRAREDRAAPVERMAIDRLPVMDHAAGILTDQVGRDLLHRLGTGQGSPLGDRLTKSNDALVGVDLEKQPTRLDEDGLEPGDTDAALTCRFGALGLGAGG